ncbi:MAG: hypothetical protein FJ171_04490 [Gammaproteobacteria bacterium]|nr:hypothetical protein [Gammaproteobacteria bacterium]
MTTARPALVLLLLFAGGAARASEADVTKLMKDYWRAYARSDFVAAAAYLDPRDTGALKEGLLPLFLRASQSKNVNVVPLVKAFFTGIPADQHDKMNDAQVFAGMNYMMRDVMPQVYAELNRTTTRVTRVTLPGDGTATVEYAIRVQGEDVTESDRANLHEGRWYLRTRDTPAVTIERFRMLLGLDYEVGPEVKLSPSDDGSA